MNYFLTTLVLFLVIQNDGVSSAACTNEVAPKKCTGSDHYDYIIVGGGTTGSVVAARLSEDKDVKVLLLEAGGEPLEKSAIPLLALDQLGTEMDWNYTSTTQQHCCDMLNDKKMPLFRGRTLGGTSSFDSMIYAHGNKKDYDSWKESGNEGWGFDDILPYFLKIENFIFPHDDDSDKYHGKDGPVTISHSDFKTPIAKAFIAAASELKQPVVDYNGKTQTGFTYTPQNIGNGARASSYVAYLKPAMKRDNLKVITYAYATKIIVDENKKATGIEYTPNCITPDKCKEDCIKVNADKEIIISGGVYNTPQLLLLSGIGPKAALTTLNIDVAADLPGVGQNLQDHVSVAGQFYTLNDTVSLNKQRYNTKKYLDQWKKDKTGPMTVGASTETDCFYQSKLVKDADDYPDIEVLFVSDNIIQIFKNFISPALLATMPLPMVDVVTFFPNINRPKSRGTVTLKSKNPNDPPIINPNLLDHPDDVATLAEGIKFALKIAQTKAFKKYLPLLYLGGQISYCATVLNKTSDEYYECVAKKLGIASFHTSSSCKMGPKTDPMAVVDSALKVHGLKNLRIADASIMPNIVSTHPTATCLMIGEKVSDMIKIDSVNN